MTTPLPFDERVRARSAMEAGRCRRLARAALAYEAVCGERSAAYYDAWLELTEAADALFPEIEDALEDARINCGLDRDGNPIPASERGLRCRDRFPSPEAA